MPVLRTKISDSENRSQGESRGDTFRILMLHRMLLAFFLRLLLEVSAKEKNFESDKVIDSNSSHKIRIELEYTQYK